MLISSYDFGQEITAQKSHAFETLKAEKAGPDVGYYALPSQTGLLEELEGYVGSHPYLAEITDIVIMGIGGSSLGIKAVNTFLAAHRKKNLIFLENSDPVALGTALKPLKRETSLFIVISKSGTTIETISIFKTAIKYFDLQLSLQDQARVIVITDEGSALFRMAGYYGLDTFTIPRNVGGRFSVLSAVGVVPLYIAGYDVASLLEGAKVFMERFFEGKEAHLLHKAAFYVNHAPVLPMNVLFSYTNALEDFTKWYVQLWGESLGKINKQGKHVGMTPIGLIGAVDQHSFLQLIMEGPLNKTVTFITIQDFEHAVTIPDMSLPFLEQTDFINGKTFETLIHAQCEATALSLRQQGVSVDLITLDRMDAANIGALIGYYELLTSLMGVMLDINTYDQPGVELGKKLLYDHFKGSKQ